MKKIIVYIKKTGGIKYRAILKIAASIILILMGFTFSLEGNQNEVSSILDKNESLLKELVHQEFISLRDSLKKDNLLSINKYHIHFGIDSTFLIPNDLNNNKRIDIPLITAAAATDSCIEGYNGHCWKSEVEADIGDRVIIYIQLHNASWISVGKVSFNVEVLGSSSGLFCICHVKVEKTEVQKECISIYLKHSNRKQLYYLSSIAAKKKEMNDGKIETIGIDNIIAPKTYDFGYIRPLKIPSIQFEVKIGDNNIFQFLNRDRTFTEFIPKVLRQKN
jgi:hypothetical protein